MTYSLDSIKKMIGIAKQYENTLSEMDVNDIAMCISNGNRKIGKVMNVSLMPIITCTNCSECKFLCYDIKACLQYPDTVINARMRNTVLLKKDRNEYFNRIENKISRRKKNKFFRWHVAGDIIDIDYFSRMVEIARRHSDFIFWTYTKNYKAVNEYVRTHGGSIETAIPENFSVMFSEWDGMEMNNPYDFAVFSCKLKNGNKNRTAESFNTMYRCPGNCDICKKAKLGCIGHMNTYADEH